MSTDVRLAQPTPSLTHETTLPTSTTDLPVPLRLTETPSDAHVNMVFTCWFTCFHGD